MWQDSNGQAVVPGALRGLQQVLALRVPGGSRRTRSSCASTPKSTPQTWASRLRRWIHTTTWTGCGGTSSRCSASSDGRSAPTSATWASWSGPPVGAPTPAATAGYISMRCSNGQTPLRRPRLSPNSQSCGITDRRKHRRTAGGSHDAAPGQADRGRCVAGDGLRPPGEVALASARVQECSTTAPTTWLGCLYSRWSSLCPSAPDD